jgi:hypothetical protein
MPSDGRRVTKQLLNVLRPSPLDDDVIALDVSHVAQACPQVISCERLKDKAEKSDAWQLRALLRPGRERPRRRPAEQRDELASPYVEHGLLPGTRCASLAQAQDAPERPQVLGVDLDSSESGCDQSVPVVSTANSPSDRKPWPR